MASQMQLSFTTLLLSVATASLSEPVLEPLSRRTILDGVIAAALLSIAAKWCVNYVPSAVTKRNLQVVALFWLCAELIQIFLRSVLLCQREFSSLALIGVAPFLLWAGWKFPLERWAVTAKVLLWLSIFMGGIFLLGIIGQLHWERLFEFEQPDGTAWQTPIYAEYFTPLIVRGTEQKAFPKNRITRLPWIVLGIQFLTALIFQLLFGETDRSALEVLRVWNFGGLSRMDPALLLVWLTCAVFRICVLCGMIHMVWTLVCIKPIRKGNRE